MPTVYNQRTVKSAVSSVPQNKIMDYLTASMIQGDKVPRDYGDYLISLIKEEPLPLHNAVDKDELMAYIVDLSAVPEEEQVRYVLGFDTETTSAYTDGLACSVALILFDMKKNEVLEEFYTLVNPGVSIPADATEIHKISNEDVADEKPFKEYFSKIEEMFSKADMAVGQNLQFDWKILEREYEREDKTFPFINFPYFDTMDMGKRFFGFKDVNGKKLKNPKLEEAMEFFGIESSGDYHNALVDTEATIKVFYRMLHAYDEE